MARALSPDVEISTDRSRLDVDLIHQFLSGSYWAAGRRKSVVQRSIDNSICFGAYLEGKQVGFARAVTDKAVFAYLADVFVHLQNLRVFLLRTRDAHGLYAQFGFRPIHSPENAMEILDLENDQRAL